MGECFLSQNEQSILGGLVRYPCLNDRELSDMLGFKLSTFAAVKNRLREMGCYRPVRMPAWPRLGCEMMVGATFTIYTEKARKVRSIMEKYQDHSPPELIMSFTESMNWFGLAMASSFTELERGISGVGKEASAKGLLEGGSLKTHLYPFDLTRFYNYFDFTPVLREVLTHGAFAALEEAGVRAGVAGKGGGTGEGLKVCLTGAGSIKASPGDGGMDVRSELTPKEKVVFRGLIANPDLPDRTVATHVGVSRQTVSKLRREFETSGLMTLVKMPDMGRMGLEILAVLNADFRPGAQPESKRKTCEMLRDRYPNFLLANCSINMTGIFLFRNFDMFQQMKATLSLYSRKEKLFAQDPEFTLFSLENLRRFQDHRYLPLLDKLLELDGTSGI